MVATKGEEALKHLDAAMKAHPDDIDVVTKDALTRDLELELELDAAKWHLRDRVQIRDTNAKRRPERLQYQSTGDEGEAVAREVDAARAAGETLHPLAGVPVAAPAAVVATACFGVRSLMGLFFIFMISLVGIADMALSGHSSGGQDHMGAVNSLGLHLLGVSIWCGGLIALGYRLGYDRDG